MLKLLLVNPLQVQVALLERYCSSRDTNLRDNSDSRSRSRHDQQRQH